MSQVKEVTADEVTVVVRRTLLKQTTEEVETINIRPFATATAGVKVSKRRTISDGNYGSASVEVAIYTPAYVEEVRTVYEDTLQWVDELIEVEVDKIEGALGLNTKKVDVNKVL
jgi:hypothetical protein